MSGTEPVCCDTLRKGGRMGQPNNALNVYMSRPDRIRAVLGYYLGEKIPGDWEFQEEEGFYAVRNSGDRLSFRQRDGIKRVRAGKNVFLLGLENQDSINLIYPWRLMELDCQAYGRQIERIQEKNKIVGGTYEGADDFKYRYKKSDRLDPVLNLTLYWGGKVWQEPLSLGEMTRIGELPAKVRELFGDYRVHLIHMRHIPEEDLQNMESDLKYVLGIMKHTRSGREYEAYIRENRDYFSRIPRSAVNVIDVCTSIGDIMEHIRFTQDEKNEEVADMCKAVRDMQKHAEKKGVRKGIKQGMEQGIEQGEAMMGMLMNRLLLEGRLEDARLAAVDETARKCFYEEYNMR